MKVIAVTLALLPSLAAAQPRVTGRSTVENLEAAAGAEANAAHRYTVFARRADDEGFTQVGKLFRAAAESSAVAQKNLEDSLRFLGHEPAPPTIAEVRVGTTRENLSRPEGRAQPAIEYTHLIDQARSDAVPAAITSLSLAQDAELQQAQLFSDALAQLGHNPPADYFVGRVSGELSTQPLPRTNESVTRIE